MWTLFQLSRYLERTGNFAEMRFATRLGNQRLGTGRLYAKRGVANTTSSELTSQGSDQFINADDPTNARLSLRINGIRGGSQFTPPAFFEAVMDGVIFVAEMGYDDTVRGITHFNPEADMSFAIFATSEQSTNLKAYIVLAALRGIANFMVKQPLTQRFTEFNGLVRWDGPIVGKMFLLRGRRSDGLFGEVVNKTSIEDLTGTE